MAKSLGLSNQKMGIGADEKSCGCMMVISLGKFRSRIGT